MNVFKKLGEVLTKNELKSSSNIIKPIYISPSIFKTNIDKERNTPENTKITSIKKVNTSKLFQENRDLVGKGSSYERKFVQDYLAPFKNTQPFKRHNIEDSYDIQRAERFYTLKNRISKKLSFKETQDEIFISRVMPLLLIFSNTETNSSTIVKPEVAQTPKKIYPKESYEEVPSIPKFQNDPASFANYIGLLTHTIFHFKNSSKQNGIIPILLKTLLHPENQTTAPYQTTETYNDLMYFYFKRSDFASMREVITLMKIANCRLNTKSYNIMLSGLLKVSNLKSSPNENKNLVYYLEQMNKEHITIDSITWNILGKFLVSNRGRVYFMKEMKRFNVSVDYKFVISVLKDELSNDQVTGISLLNFLKTKGISLNYNIFEFCLQMFLEEQKLNHAWVMLNYVNTENMRTTYSKTFIRIDSDILNVFLISFSNQGRLDLALMIFNTFTQEFKIRPNIDSFTFLFKALVRNGYSDKFPVILKWMKNTKMDYGLGMRNSYWKVKAESIAKFNCTKTVNDLQVEFFKELMKDFKFPNDVDKKITYNTWTKGDSKRLKVLRYINCRPNNTQSNNPKNNKRIISNDETAAKKRAYLNRIRHIAVQKAMVKRIPYAKDWYGALNKELKERHILEEPKSE